MKEEKSLALNSSSQKTTGIKPTKLAIVIAELKANPNVFYAGEIIKDEGIKPIPVKGTSSGGWSETVDIIVSPATPTFDPSDLNKFMLSLDKPIVRRLRKLYKGVKATWYDSAYPENGGIHVGKLYYDEPFAIIQTHIQKTVTSLDPEATARLKMLTGISEKDLDEEVWRRIWVRVYPEPITAGTLFGLESGAYNGTLLFAEGEGLEDLVGGKSRLRKAYMDRLVDYYAQNGQQQLTPKIAKLPGNQGNT